MSTFDQNVVGYLELLKLPYTGCNSRGLLLGRDKALAKKLLTYHRIPVPGFAIVPARPPRPERRRAGVPALREVADPGRLHRDLPGLGGGDDEKLEERVRFIHESIGTDALVEQLHRRAGALRRRDRATTSSRPCPSGSCCFTKMPEEVRKIATERLKWSLTYQKKHGIVSDEAKDLPPGWPSASATCASASTGT